jgi:hypothetical protein
MEVPAVGDLFAKNGLIGVRFKEYLRSEVKVNISVAYKYAFIKCSPVDRELEQNGKKVYTIYKPYK